MRRWFFSYVPFDQLKLITSFWSRETDPSDRVIKTEYFYLPSYPTRQFKIMVFKRDLTFITWFLPFHYWVISSMHFYIRWSYTYLETSWGFLNISWMNSSFGFVLEWASARLFTRTLLISPSPVKTRVAVSWQIDGSSCSNKLRTSYNWKLGHIIIYKCTNLELNTRHKSDRRDIRQGRGAHLFYF